MKWTGHMPTKPGHYWMRILSNDGTVGPTVVKVCEQYPGAVMWVNELWTPAKIKGDDAVWQFWSEPLVPPA